MKIDVKNLSVEDFASQFDFYSDGEWVDTFDGDYYALLRRSFSDRYYAYHRDTGQRVENVEIEGGGEGGAEECSTVLKIGEQYICVTYRYYSHDGYDFDYAELFEVKPVEVTVTQYHRA